MSQLNRIATLSPTRLLEAAAGLGMLLAGLTIYSNHGFASSMVFFAGFLMIPLGLILLGTAIVKVTVDEEI